MPVKRTAKKTHSNSRSNIAQGNAKAREVARRQRLTDERASTRSSGGSRGMNMAILIGNVGADPELRATSSGVHVAQFSLATNAVWTGKDGERHEKTEWHRVVCWQALADIVDQYVTKGMKLSIVGTIQYQQWEDDEGNTRYSTQIVAQQLLMLGGGAAKGARDVDNFDEESEEIIPF